MPRAAGVAPAPHSPIVNASLTQAIPGFGGMQISLQAGPCEGGMSRVWTAITAAGDRVAVKTPGPQVTDPAAARQLILREYAFLQRLRHRNIVSVLGLVELDTGPGLVLEHVGGGDLVSLAGAHPRHWLRAAAQLARALAYVHDSGIVHRDIKARNVLLRPGDEPCLIDFSLAAEAGAAAPGGVGTVAYQSPNQRRGGPPRASDDVYAFAALLYELWTGTLPCGAATIPEAMKTPGGLRGPLRAQVCRGALSRLAGLVSGTLSGVTKGPDGGIEPFCHTLELAVAERSRGPTR